MMTPFYIANDTDNATSVTSVYLTNLDDLSISEKVAGIVLTFVFCCFCSLAVVSMNKTRTTPKTARFLSSALIIYDVVAVVCFAIRKFITNHSTNIVIQTAGVAGALLAYITVGLMSLERLLIFCAPNLYLRRARTRVVRKFAYTVWLVVFFAYIFVRYGICFLMYEDAVMLDVIGRCNTASFLFYGFFLLLTIIISYVCYFKIIAILRSQVNTDNDFTALKSIHFYRSTSLVFAYILSITVLTIAYTLVIALGLDTSYLRISTDVINLAQCVADPCMYILWYRETRMEMLKILANLHPCFSRGIEDMRMQIFNIVTSDTKRHYVNNKVHPITDPGCKSVNQHTFLQQQGVSSC